MKKFIIALTFMISALAAIAQNDNTSKSRKTYLSSEAGKVIDNREQRVKSNQKEQIKNQKQSRQDKDRKKKIRKRNRKEGNFGFY